MPRKRDPRRRHDGGEIQPCAKCGGEKLPGQGRRYCAACRELADWRTARKRKARSVRHRQPCQICGGVKPPGHGRRYCDRCLAKPPRMCRQCGKVKVEAPAYKCDGCKAARVAREAERNKRRSRERRRRLRAAGRIEKRSKAKAVRQMDNEGRRLLRREKRAAEGKALRVVSQEEYEQRYGNGYGRAPSIDVGVLTPWLQNVTDFEALAESAQVDQSSLYRIMNGHRTRLSVRAADRLCVALDLPFSFVFGDAA